MKKRVISMLLSVAIFLSLFAGMSVVNVSAYSTFDALKAKYLHGTKWNSTYQNGRAIQCHGFALQLGYELSDIDPYKWTYYYDTYSYLSTGKLKPGDIIRAYNDGHTIMVTNVNGSAFNYVDCNWLGGAGNNIINWNGYCTISNGNILSIFGKANYVMSAPYDLSKGFNKDDSFFDFWGQNTDSVLEVSGNIKLWFKVMGCDYLHSDVNVSIDDKCIGTIYPDDSGYFSISIETNNFNNGQHKINAVFRNAAGVEKHSSDLYIEIKNFFDFWGINIGELMTVSDDIKLWLKVIGCDYTSSYADIYIDDKKFSTIYPDNSGYFSININTHKLNNGQHKINAYFNNQKGIEKHSSDIYIDIKNPIVQFWGYSGNEIENDSKIWLKVENCDYLNSTTDIYIDDILYKTNQKTDDAGFISFLVDSSKLKNGNHFIYAVLKTSDIEIRTDKICFNINNVQNIIGDVNCDGKIDIDDVTETQKYVANMISFTEEQQKIADVTKDGKINVDDVTLIQKYVAGLAVIE